MFSILDSHGGWNFLNSVARALSSHSSRVTWLVVCGIPTGITVRMLTEVINQVKRQQVLTNTMLVEIQKQGDSQFNQKNCDCPSKSKSVRDYDVALVSTSTCDAVVSPYLSHPAREISSPGPECLQSRMWVDLPHKRDGHCSVENGWVIIVSFFGITIRTQIR